MILFAIGSVFMVEPDPGFLYANARGDCSGRSAFLYNAIYNAKNNYDVIFVGSSRTMNDINDSLLNTLGGASYLNMGYCRYGRNLEYFFAREFCKTHRPKKIVVEVRGSEGDSPHPMTAFFMPASEVAEGFLTGRTETFSGLYDKFLCNLKFIRSKLFNHPVGFDPAQDPVFGFWAREAHDDMNALNVEKRKDSLEVINETRGDERLNRNSEFYLKKLKTLCAETKASLYFLYLPGFGKSRQKPRHSNQLEELGHLLNPPDSIFCTPANFSDHGHLNRHGAWQLSLWLNDCMTAK